MICKIEFKSILIETLLHLPFLEKVQKYEINEVLAYLSSICKPIPEDLKILLGNTK